MADSQDRCKSSLIVLVCLAPFVSFMFFVDAPTCERKAGCGMSAGFWLEIRNRWERVRRSGKVAQPTETEAVARRRQGERLLRRMLGPRAEFREGQWEAIEAVVTRAERVLVVQRTGWGKSIVYFLATRLLRERGAGPTLLISPLLSLMRNQVQMARRIGVRAYTIHSENRDEWDAAETALARDECDILLVSPERLAIREFLERTLSRTRGRLGMLAIDEAHCISDWGHDFRPDYRRICRILEHLPSDTTVLATTATANDRVLADVTEQLGPRLTVLRCPLVRRSIALQVIGPMTQAERLAWLADQVPQLPGTGIVYCLTVADCRRVSDWLLSRGIAAPPYYAALEEYRPEREALLSDNRVKALVATVALGMGFDKPDLGFVIHYECPASVVGYYQQVGRAGRSIEKSHAVLLHSEEDGAIHDFLIRTAVPSAEEMRSVLDALECGLNHHRGGLTETELLERVNVSPARLEKLVKQLEVEGAIAGDWGRYRRTTSVWQTDAERQRRVGEQRRRELDRMNAYLKHRDCLMTFLTRELDDPHSGRCGHCEPCAGPSRPLKPPEALVREAMAFLQCDDRRIEPRKQWPAGASPAVGLQPNEPGRALCLYGDGGWGRAVATGKYRVGRYSDSLVAACVELIRDRWRPTPVPAWVTAVPSRRHPDLVPDFAARLARALGLPFHPVLVQVRETAEQKLMQNSAQQARNVRGAFRVEGPCPAGPVLLIDDVVDSRWTLTACGHLIRAAGGGPVYPVALAEAAGRAGSS
jgi:ATP-dependent DNA helicase RecQ